MVVVIGGEYGTKKCYAFMMKNEIVMSIHLQTLSSMVNAYACARSSLGQ